MTEPAPRIQLLLYLPVLHAGYEKLLDSYPDAAEILLLGSSFGELDQFKVIRKEIRALSPERAAEYLRGVDRRGVDRQDADRRGVDRRDGRAREERAREGERESDRREPARVRGPARVRVVEVADLPGAVTAELLVVPDEDVLREVVTAYRLDERASVRFERTFLRWDREWSRADRPARPDATVTADELDRAFMGIAVAASSRSSDWWRQVGAVAVRDGEILFVAHNRHLPSEYSPYLDGDPRNSFSRGRYVELSTAIHAEAALVAEAARTGVPLAGADLYVSTFPCPACARLVAASGVRRCFYAGPYSMLDGDELLRRSGVELVWVDLADS